MYCANSLGVVELLFGIGGLSTVGVCGVVEPDDAGRDEPRPSPLNPTVEGLVASGGGAGERVGEAGWLPNELAMGVNGVLDGLSTGTLYSANPLIEGLCLTLAVVAGGLVGTEGRLRLVASSSSSMVGKFWANSKRLRDSRSEITGDVEAGDGGPRVDGDTKEVGRGGGEGSTDDKDEVICDDDDGEDTEKDGEVAGGEVGSSRDIRLFVVRTRPLSCKDLRRSAMVFRGGSSLGLAGKSVKATGDTGNAPLLKGLELVFHSVLPFG